MQSTFLCRLWRIGLVLTLLATSGGCGGGGGDGTVSVSGDTGSSGTSSGGSETTSSIHIGTSSDQTGFGMSVINGQGSSQSTVTFQVLPGTRSLLVQTNIDGTSDPALAGVMATLSSPSNTQQRSRPHLAGLSIQIGGGAVTNSGGTPLPSFTNATTPFRSALQGLTNVVTPTTAVTSNRVVV